LTTGEDPVFFSGGTPGFHQLADLVKTVKSETGLSVMVSPGVVPDTVMADLAEAGASWYACYQETHRPELFQALRTGQSYDKRLEKKRLAHRSGMLIEEGILCGIGETHADVARSIAVMRCLDADQVRVMNFIPQPGTPMADCLPSDSRREFMIIAVMRLIFPDRLIPASLDVGGLDGLKQRLDAGANVVTSLVPPGQGLAGVAQSSLDIENARRSTGSVLPVLEACGLRRAGLDEYDTWICGRQRNIRKAACARKKIA
jgi:methylornithine synthase